MITIVEIAIIVIDTPKKNLGAPSSSSSCSTNEEESFPRFVPKTNSRGEGEGAERLPPVIKGCNGPINRILRPRVN